MDKAIRPLVNVGTITRRQLDDILVQFPKERINMSNSNDVMINISNKAGTQIMSAVRVSYDQWHVRAVDGLIRREYRENN